jgi:hypothetical protein
MFGKKTKNRRFERHHVLDVKLRSQHVRARRLRLFSTLLAGLIGTAALGFGLWKGCEWVLDELVYRNPSFSIAQLEVSTDGVIPVREIVSRAGVKPGDNLLALDLMRIRRDLELVSLIRHAAVERVLPNTLKIRVSEREPIAKFALIQSQSNGAVREIVFCVDPHGWVIAPMYPWQPSSPYPFAHDDLPLLTGISQGDLISGRPIESGNVRAALRFVMAFARSPMAGTVDLQSIDVGNPSYLLVRTGQGNEVTFSMQNFDQQLRRWRVVHDYGRSVGRSIATLDLSVANNVPARWQETAGLEPEKPVKPIRPRKRNV